MTVYSHLEADDVRLHAIKSDARRTAAKLASASPWPEPMRPEARIGVIGEFLEAVEQHTEADEAALTISLLVAFANAVGPEPHVMIGDATHAARLFAAIVGHTGDGRKGTSLSSVRRFLEAADPMWADECLASGAVSGEGVIYGVRDDITEREVVYDDDGKIADYREKITEVGAADKRRLWVIEELASILQANKREGSILSAIFRQAWDGGRLETGAKKLAREGHRCAHRPARPHHARGAAGRPVEDRPGQRLREPDPVGRLEEVEAPLPPEADAARRGRRGRAAPIGRSHVSPPVR
jgi:hypothetical protein